LFAGMRSSEASRKGKSKKYRLNSED